MNEKKYLQEVLQRLSEETIDPQDVDIYTETINDLPKMSEKLATYFTDEKNYERQSASNEDGGRDFSPSGHITYEAHQYNTWLMSEEVYKFLFPNKQNVEQITKEDLTKALNDKQKLKNYRLVDKLDGTMGNEQVKLHGVDFYVAKKQPNVNDQPTRTEDNKYFIAFNTSVTYYQQYSRRRH